MRQRRANLVGGLKADFQILAHPIDRKAKIESVGEHGLVAVDHLPTARSPVTDHLDHRRTIQPGFLAKGQGLG
jgi:hypothetical protein